MFRRSNSERVSLPKTRFEHIGCAAHQGQGLIGWPRGAQPVCPGVHPCAARGGWNAHCLQLASATHTALRTLREQNFEMKRGICFEMKMESAPTLLLLLLLLA